MSEVFRIDHVWDALSYVDKNEFYHYLKSKWPALHEIYSPLLSVPASDIKFGINGDTLINFKKKKSTGVEISKQSYDRQAFKYGYTEISGRQLVTLGKLLREWHEQPVQEEITVATNTLSEKYDRALLKDACGDCYEEFDITTMTVEEAIETFVTDLDIDAEDVEVLLFRSKDVKRVESKTTYRIV